MKRSKIFISLLLCLTLVFSAFGCGKDNKKPTTSASTDSGDTFEEFVLDKEEGKNQLTLYWNVSTNLETCDVWMWWGEEEGRGYELHRSAYGAKCVVNIPKDITKVGFIVRKNCSDPCGTAWGEATKDYAADREAIITGEDTVIYLKSGEGNQYTSNDGGKTLELIKTFNMADMASAKAISYNISPAKRITSKEQVKLYCEGEEITYKSLTSLNMSSPSGVITVEDSLDITKAYELEIEDYGRKPVIPMSIFSTANFKDQYNYDGDDLGAVIDGENTTFKVWAPTASAVQLNLFERGDTVEAYKVVDMTKGEKGVWSYTEKCGHGTYYTYSVTTALGTQEAVDPYAKATGVNGNRGMVVDLARTNPDGWDGETYVDNVNSYSDAAVWEVHVRDFSNNITSSQYKGKYLAFTETGLKNSNGIPVGVDYLKNLGITHVHLQPVYDFATIDETSDKAQFNWGYDPKNYNVPEGSYSTDAYNGEVRINEFKQMVQALHAKGIGVIMDVVYNHTYDANSNFNKIVPYYYYRYEDGKNTSASGCGNDTASEREMFGKFMVDSVTYWLKEYKVDGFRFDLMGLHDINTMDRIEKAVHAINPKALLYGEGWTMGSTIDGSDQANQNNIYQIEKAEGAIGGVAVFNDAMRDAVKGSVFDAADPGYINGNPSKLNALKIAFSIKGGVPTSGSTIAWSVNDAMVVNYVSAHDNLTLWDKLTASCPTATKEEKVKMTRLAASIVMISKGMPFFLAGEEMLRTKGGDANSYASPDSVNNLNWEVLKEGSAEYETMLFYKQLIQLRKDNPFFTQATVDCAVEANGTISVSYTMGESVVAYAYINPYTTEKSFRVADGQWQGLFGVEGTVENMISVAPQSVVVVKA